MYEFSLKTTKMWLKSYYIKSLTTNISAFQLAPNSEYLLTSPQDESFVFCTVGMQLLVQMSLL